MAVKIAINGFGRIGRLVARASLLRDDVELVAVNDLGDPKGGVLLFKYDSIHGQFPQEVKLDGNRIIAGSKSFQYLSERDPEKLPWNELGADIIVEATGVFKTKETVSRHLQAGAKKAVICAPAKGVDLTVVMGVNNDMYKPAEHHILSNASCTTNCLAPVAKVLLQEFGIERGMMNTIHSYTNDQRVLDLEHNDMRRARAASLSIIPTTTGAASAVGLVIPELKGKLDGLAVRVPTPNVSLVDLTVELGKAASTEEINAAFKTASESYLKGILRYTEEPLVSRDYNGESCSAVVDGPLTMTMGGNMAKVIAWYDNEWAYSLRVVDLVTYIAKQGI
ncbi:Glyceraldehyde-3-phosphate dehydrogenase, type I [Syntrophomonas zehnderi OL-4]|uniref:Glyceraldehyde-3-phosphate dehydrogenase n=1 Tax=Syntrophomonas zehnderi OL-4 TaxID=690567 RepID=A0A0E4CKQ2_9FIRM|nr:type I glyceraldehyde-3-phosphate dehydrogenase [Syntrophomonas zehnderi]CQB51974.1 Glyceraldehyde-3-phosphate dehydrogenase, type I [Syntrophomonas zehnderi OL-4]